ncbi:MAG TPA: SPOR domain-containing protein, partial [Bacteroidia bacterium]|nr:SPOR domain-containing protein [Bacteroidia bacterium]
MKIGNYIFELLHQHDCVIVPQFGGFVARYKNATIHPVQHLFSPPSKIVAFNSDLTTNDGLLANYISQKLLLSYSDSCKLINDFVTLCKAQLEANQRIQIEKIGVLFFD